MISKYVLVKNGRTAILCGVRHVEGKKALYEEIQRVINQVVGGGYILFYEGIRRDPTIGLASQNAKRLMDFWSGMIRGGYPYLGEMRGLETQRESLRYPPEGINADISLEELVNAIDRAGVRCSRILLYVVSALLTKKPRAVSEYPLLLRIVMTIANRRFSTWFGNSLWSLLNKSFPFTVDYRNEAIFRIVATQSGGKNIFLLYGASHVPGLLKHLESDGWKIKQAPETTAG